MDMENLEKIDHTAIRVSQVMVIILNILAFTLNLPWLVILTTLVIAMGVVVSVPGFVFVYRYALKPLGMLKPDIRLDHHEPHRFAAFLGALLMGGSSIALLSGASTLGWLLAWMMVALCALNAFVGFCVGCMIYYWLGRLRLPGFYKAPPKGTFPGRQPDTRVYDES
jgi:hypothetical protein